MAAFELRCIVCMVYMQVSSNIRPSISLKLKALLCFHLSAMVISVPNMMMHLLGLQKVSFGKLTLILKHSKARVRTPI